MVKGESKDGKINSKNINRLKKKSNKKEKIQKEKSNNSKNKYNIKKTKKNVPPIKKPHSKSSKTLNIKNDNNSKYNSDISNKFLITKKKANPKAININFIPINTVFNMNNYKLKKNNKKYNTNNYKKLNIYGIKKSSNKKIINKKENKSFINLNDRELNTLSYEYALLYDKRTFCQYYKSLLIKKQLILFAFIPVNDYNLFSIKVSLLLLSFSLYFTVNGFFFSDSTMHKIFIENGSYNLIYQIPQLIYTTLVSSLINIILKILSLSESNIIRIKNLKKNGDRIKKVKLIRTFITINFIFFYILSFLLLFFFWYFISCFCGVYTNTQIILIKDIVISFGLSMIYPFGLNLIPGIFRIYALRSKKHDKKIIYQLSALLYLLF